MLFAAGAALSAIDLVSSLLPAPSAASSKSGFKPAEASGFALPVPAERAPAGSGFSAPPQLSSEALNTLLQAQSQSRPATATDRASALAELFTRIDVNGDGRIAASELKTALGTGASDRQAADLFASIDGDGDSSISFNEMSSAARRNRRDRPHAGGAGTSGVVDLAAANGAAASYNLTELLVQRHAKVLAASAKSSLSMNV